MCTKYKHWSFYSEANKHYNKIILFYSNTTLKTVIIYFNWTKIHNSQSRVIVTAMRVKLGGMNVIFR